MDALGVAAAGREGSAHGLGILRWLFWFSTDYSDTSDTFGITRAAWGVLSCVSCLEYFAECKEKKKKKDMSAKKTDLKSGENSAKVSLGRMLRAFSV